MDSQLPVTFLLLPVFLIGGTGGPKRCIEDEVLKREEGRIAGGKGGRGCLAPKGGTWGRQRGV